jgi:hypothetical protein
VTQDSGIRPGLHQKARAGDPRSVRAVITRNASAADCDTCIQRSDATLTTYRCPVRPRHLLEEFPISESQSSIPSAVGNDPQAQLQDITRTPEKGDVLERLAAAGLVSLGRGLPVSDADTDRVTVIADGSVAPVAGAIGRVDPLKSRAALSGGRILGMYVQDCLISTEAKPPYHRLPSFNTHTPYHIVYLLSLRHRSRARFRSVFRSTRQAPFGSLERVAQPLSR